MGDERLTWRRWGVGLGVLVGLLLLTTWLVREVPQPWSWVAAGALGLVVVLDALWILSPRRLPAARPIAIGGGIMAAALVAMPVIIYGVPSGRLDVVLLASAALTLMGYGLVVVGLRARESSSTSGAALAAAACAISCAIAVVATLPLWGVGVAVLAAIVTGHLATELWAGWRFAHWPDPDAAGPAGQSGERRRSRVRLAVIAAVFAGGTAVGLIVWADSLEGTVYLVLAFALLALVGVAESEAPVTVVTVVVAVALLAVAPPPEAKPDVAQVTPGDAYYLVLGDSYTSGEGGSRFIDGTNDAFLAGDVDRVRECRRSPEAWGIRLAVEADGATDPVRLGGIEVPSKVWFAACSGSVTENISAVPYTKDGEEQSGPAQLWLSPGEHAENPQLREYGDPRFIIMGVGGNDASFSQIASACLGPGDCDAMADHYQKTRGPDRDGTHYEALPDIEDDLVGAYTRVVEQYQGVPVFVSAYPEAVDPDSSCLFFSREERAFVVSYIHQLNDRIQVTIEDLKANGNPAKPTLDYSNLHFLASIERSMDGARLCERTGFLDTGINPVNLNPVGGRIRDALHPGKLIHNSVHPTDDGHELMLDAVLADDGDDLGRAREGLAPCRGCASDPETWTRSEIQAALGPGLALAAFALIGWSALWALVASFDRAANRWLRTRPEGVPPPE